ncbi:hypothetical protein SAMN02745244_03754 [Tessaracoccus bendigoensis DSM 12906]|uniref:Yip1 domain-containing protein n=1 Tax=Tessaracoccus bendigoensis DSM 12906 TaxID=1123357 RepID=A0A1M6NZY6_9ACTN|nr:hypothetical protein [Tessaracoccus bendigoensis]SHK01236.1 hypothetical protein SAMN02745244_03754 [Tessaracoccus bendigoensis DSM 12906]
MREVFDVLWDALSLNPALFQLVGADPWAKLWPAIGVALLAALSTMAGHVAILKLNHISGLRLLGAVTFSAIAMVLLQTSQLAVTWLVASISLQRPLLLLPLVVVGLYSTAPLTLNFLTAIPHFGMMLGRVWQAWSYLIVVVGVAYTFHLGFWWALGFTLVGWVVMQLLSRLLRHPLDWLGSRAWTLATGRPTMVTSRDILSGAPIVPVVQRTEDQR